MQRKVITDCLSQPIEWTFWKKIKNFNIYIIEDLLEKNIYKIEGIYPISAKQTIELLSDPEVRQAISNNSVRCKEIKRLSKDVWYEQITYLSNTKKSLLYSIEKFILSSEKNTIMAYSEDILNLKNKVNKRDNLLTLITSKDLDNNISKLEAIFTFGEFEMIQESVVKASVNHFETFLKMITN